ncbi:30S ribosome-binding factor RbfA [Calorimonas adulescens]|jgi:ribosome-binding factor A|uniref:Ribosome-binding factor A n=1 Tax=Calorimonas adulescens TaxID=2606906 RepID=A0A5D8QFM9_9THEO|nr:30S ribosome-binding factor RbfA [Calorimonas adulescens]TZE83311.1 30S ribosome-binding factor RbfA [Calorimonas adulescens]
MSIKNERVAEEIKRDIGIIIKNELKDPRISELCSITKVKLSNDFSYSKIFVSVYGDEVVKTNTLQGLKNASGYIRRELSKRLKIKHVPEINFILDDSIESGIRISKIIDELKEKENDSK